jgi:Cys-tRNA(Pro) deacylase
MNRSVQTVVEAGRALGVEIEAREFPEHTRTVAEAARVVGVDVAQIVKALVFAVDGEPVLALLSGCNLLDEKKLASAAGGQSAWRLDAEAVREATGFAVGGIPPFGHQRPLRVFLDEDLARHQELWAAAGSPRVNFCIGPDVLLRATRGTMCDLARR